MTSVQRTSPLDQLFSAQGPISSELLDKAISGAKPEIQTAIMNDLRELVATKGLGEKTPVVTDELAAKLKDLPASEKLRPINNLATHFFKAKETPPSAESIYQIPFLVRSQVVGALTAVEGQLSAKTPEEKQVKERLTSLIGSAESDASLALLVGAWSSLAEPAEVKGTYTLSRDAVDALPQALEMLAKGMAAAKQQFVQKTTQAMVAALKEPGVAANVASAASSSSASSKIGGKTEEELKSIVDKALAEAQVGRFVYDPNMLRPDRYQAIHDKVMQHPITAQLLPAVRRMLSNMEAQRRDSETLRGKEISASTPPERTDAMLRAMFDATREVANELGAGEDLTVVRIAESQPNAYVYKSDFDKPRVVVHDSTARMCWDSEKKDWLGPVVGIDQDGNRCDPSAPDCAMSGPAGKLIYQGVIAHELTHIRDGVTELRVVLSFLLGNGLFGADSGKGASHVHSEACGCSLATVDQSKVIQELLGSEELKQFLPSGGLTKDPAVIAERLQRLVGPEMAVDGETLIDQIGLEAEVTADHGAAALQGTNKFLATFFDIIIDSSERGSSADRQSQLDESLNRDLTKIAREDLMAKVGSSYNGLAAIGSSGSHPPIPFRAVGNAQFLKGDVAAKIKEFKELPPSLKLIAGAQAIDAQIEKLDDNLELMKRNLALSTDIIAEQMTAEVRKGQLLDKLKPVTKQLAELAFADGATLDGKKLKGYVSTIIGFLQNGGVSLFQEDASGFQRSDGKPIAPACVNVYKQLGDELSAKVEAAGDKLTEAQRETWGVVIEQLEIYAGKGADQLGELRRAKAMSKLNAQRKMRI